MLYLNDDFKHEGYLVYFLNVLVKMQKMLNFFITQYFDNFNGRI